MDKDITTLLKEIKDRTGWSEADLAKKIGVTQPTVSRMLNGQKDCKVSTFQAITALHKAIFSKRATRGGKAKSSE